MTRVKICGITNIEDALHAEACGADALGFVFAESPRRIDAARAGEIIARLGPFITPVGVFVDPTEDEVSGAAESGIRIAQIHGAVGGENSPLLHVLPTIRALQVRDAQSLAPIPAFCPRPKAVLLDAYWEGLEGGTGKTFDWELAASASRFGIPIVLAGGLDEENVSEAIARVRPYGVDASSRLEASPGRKDPSKVERFIRAVRRCDAATPYLE